MPYKMNIKGDFMANMSQFTIQITMLF